MITAYVSNSKVWSAIYIRLIFLLSTKCSEHNFLDQILAIGSKKAQLIHLCCLDLRFVPTLINDFFTTMKLLFFLCIFPPPPYFIISWQRLDLIIVLTPLNNSFLKTIDFSPFLFKFTFFCQNGHFPYLSFLPAVIGSVIFFISDHK